MNVTDHSGDTAKRIAEIYSHTECLLAIEDYAAKKQAKVDADEPEEDEESSSVK